MLAKAVKYADSTSAECKDFPTPILAVGGNPPVMLKEETLEAKQAVIKQLKWSSVLQHFGPYWSVKEAQSNQFHVHICRSHNSNMQNKQQ